MAPKKAPPPPELTEEQVAAAQLLAEKDTVITALTATVSRHVLLSKAILYRLALGSQRAWLVSWLSEQSAQQRGRRW